MKSTRCVAVLGLLAVGATALAGDPPPDTAALVASAGSKLAAGDAKGAEADLTKAIGLAAEDAELRGRRARARAQLGDVPGTLADLRKATELDPKGHALDLKVWRVAVETSRASGGSKEPDLGLIQAEVEDIRGKRFKAPVASALQSPAEFGKSVGEQLEKELPAERRGDIQAGLRRLGLLDPAIDLNKELTDALMSQAAAYYDPEKKKFFYLVSDMSPELLETTAAHELVHALQDQYHDLAGWFRGVQGKPGEPRNDDLELAYRSVAEGEATYVQMVWQLEHMMKGMPRAQSLASARMALPFVSAMDLEQFIKQAKQQVASLPPDSSFAKSIAQMDTIQPYILVPLVTAYLSGANLVQTVEAAGGWEAVDKLYGSPPASAEQCLHPEKYAKKRDLPTRLALPDFPELAAKGWRLADAAVHGELHLRVLLLRGGVASAAAKKATAGWDGDLYRAWRDAGGRTAIVLATTWDTEGDASEFFEAYRSALAKKYPKLAPEAAGESGRYAYGCGDEALGTGLLLLRGREVLALEGFPTELRTAVAAKLAEWKVDHVE